MVLLAHLEFSNELSSLHPYKSGYVNDVRKVNDFKDYLITAPFFGIIHELTLKFVNSRITDSVTKTV